MNIWHDINGERIKKDDFVSVIEIQKNGRNKYELDKETGMLKLDRVLYTATHYPANYGFIPSTLSEDGDPIDVLVITEYPVVSGAVIPSKPIGVLIMEDEKGMDEKIICVPAKKLDKSYENINDIKDLPEQVLLEIKHFFEHYKDLESGKWVKVSGMEGAEKAKEIIKKFAK